MLMMEEDKEEAEGNSPDSIPCHRLPGFIPRGHFKDARQTELSLEAWWQNIGLRMLRAWVKPLLMIFQHELNGVNTF